MCPVGLCPCSIQLDHHLLQARCSAFGAPHRHTRVSPVQSQDSAHTKAQGWENALGGSSIRGTLVFMLK